MPLRKLEPVVVALSVDVTYAAGAAVVIASLGRCLSAKRRLEIWIIHNGLDDGHLTLLQRATALTQANLNLYQITDYRLSLPLRSDYISAATFGRLYLGKILPRQVRRVLYLDCDTLVTGDLLPLWESDLGGRIVGAVPEATKGVFGTPRTYEHPQDPRLDTSAPYFNAGVLLIDLAQWRKNRIGEKAASYIRRYRPPLMDQDGLNAELVGTWMQLDRMWNVTSFWFRSPSRQRRYGSLLRRARIVHFVGHRKPWLRSDVWMGSHWQTHLEELLKIPHRSLGNQRRASGMRPVSRSGKWRR